MIIQLNKDYFIVMDEDFEDAKKRFGNDNIKIAEWIELNGILIPGEDYFILERKEVEAVWQEFKNTFISHDNDLCNLVFEKILRYLEEKKDVRQSKEH